MKIYRVEIFKRKQIVYDNTELVDERDLHVIDYEGYNKDHPRRTKAQNNEDLQIVSREASDSSPSPTRGPSGGDPITITNAAQQQSTTGAGKKAKTGSAKSASKGKKKGGKKKKVTGKSSSMTFVHMNQQEQLVIYLVQEDENEQLPQAERKEMTPQ